jgi:hypothetical protein
MTAVGRKRLTATDLRLPKADVRFASSGCGRRAAARPAAFRAFDLPECLRESGHSEARETSL